MRMEIRAFVWKGDCLQLLDQRELPLKEVWLELKDHKDVASAIREMAVRGAPAIGCVTAYGFALGVKRGYDPDEVFKTLAGTRPTARNLFRALEVMMEAFKKGEDLEETAKTIERNDLDANLRMGEIGQSLIEKNARVLTHCNTGALATAGWGTALGVIRSAHRAGKDPHVWVDETRPYLQGSRLTAWELVKEGISHTLITDSTAGFLMKRGLVDIVIVGADRITAGGDVANKIGTYSLAVLARNHNIPFYVCAPSSTFDLSIERGEDIPIEERSGKEISKFGKTVVAPEKTPAFYLSFDVTPSELITGIITEKGIISPVTPENIRRWIA